MSFREEAGHRSKTKADLSFTVLAFSLLIVKTIGRQDLGPRNIPLPDSQDYENAEISTLVSVLPYMAKVTLRCN